MKITKEGSVVFHQLSVAAVVRSQDLKYNLCAVVVGVLYCAAMSDCHVSLKWLPIMVSEAMSHCCIGLFKGWDTPNRP